MHRIGASAALALGVALLLAGSALPARAGGAAVEPFPAARVGSWALPAIAFLDAEGILHGVAPGRLGGSDLVTQEEAITLIGRTLGWSPKFPQNPSSQVDGFAQPYVARAEALGVTSTFPRAPTSRLEAVQWLVQLLTLPPATIQNPFTDVPDALAPSVLSAVQAGIVQGTSPTTFNPLGEVTRAQFVAMLFAAQLAQHESGALSIDGATYFSRSGLTLVRMDADNWTLLSGSEGLRAVSGALRKVSVQDTGFAVQVTETTASGMSTLTVPEKSGSLQGPDGHTVTPPKDVPMTAAVFLLPLP